jgi:hypothetical protein
MAHTPLPTDAKSGTMPTLPEVLVERIITTTRSSSMLFVAATTTEEAAQQQLVSDVKAEWIGMRPTRHATKWGSGCARWLRWMMTSAASPDACSMLTKSGRALHRPIIGFIRKMRPAIPATTKATSAADQPLPWVLCAAVRTVSAWIQYRALAQSSLLSLHSRSAQKLDWRFAETADFAVDAKTLNATPMGSSSLEPNPTSLVESKIHLLELCSQDPLNSTTHVAAKSAEAVGRKIRKPKALQEVK